MGKITTILFLSALLTSASFAATETVNPPQTQTQLDTKEIEKLTHVQGTLDPSTQQFKIAIPRTDLSVLVNGVKLSPGMGLTSRAIFSRDNNTTQVKGYLVLTEDQINPVTLSVLENNLTVTELHNHFLWESPTIMFLHFAGSGDEAKLAQSVSNVLADIKKTRGGKGELPTGIIDTSVTTLNPETINTALGVKALKQEGVYSVNTTLKPKNTTANLADVVMTAKFAGTEDAAVVEGEIAFNEANLLQVLKLMHQANITLVALHQDEAYEKTHSVTLHYWGVGKLATLVKGLHDALTVATA